MRYDPILFRNKYRIPSARLVGWDYARPGFYFVTICTHGRTCCLGDIRDGKMCKSWRGKIVDLTWRRLPGHYPNCALDTFVIMPNHVHGIVRIGHWGDNHPADFGNGRHVETGLKPVSTEINATNCANAHPHSLSEIIRGFKTFTARSINERQGTIGERFWQPRFHDHVIRNADELERIRRYIRRNPEAWRRDRNNE